MKLAKKIKDIEYEDIQSPQELLKFMDKIKYGWIDSKGKKYKGEVDPEKFFKSYKLQTPEELKESEIGVCCCTRPTLHPYTRRRLPCRNSESHHAGCYSLSSFIGHRRACSVHYIKSDSHV